MTCKRFSAWQTRHQNTIAFCQNFCIFFFQAEDGIRDYKVTGVQTCALPICRRPSRPRTARRPRRPTGSRRGRAAAASAARRRSEERRVGKECRTRGSTYRQKKESAGGAESGELLVEG